MFILLRTKYVFRGIRCLIAETLLALLKDVLLDATALGDRDHVTLILLANAEDVSNTGGEGLALGVLDVDDVEATRVLVTRGDGPHPTVILSLSHHASSASLELDDLCHLPCCQVNLDDIVYANQGVWVADGAAIVCGDEGDASDTQSELVVIETVEHVAALGVEKHTEVLVSLLDGDDIVEATGEVGVGTDAAVDLHQTHHADLLHLLLGEGIFETVTEDEHQGEALAELVGTGRWAWGPGAAHLVEHPVLGGIKPFQMLLWTTCHGWVPGFPM